MASTFTGRRVLKRQVSMQSSRMPFQVVVMAYNFLRLQSHKCLYNSEFSVVLSTWLCVS